MPKWLHECVDKYIAKGMSEKEAWKRCNGAYSKRKKKKHKK